MADLTIDIGNYNTILTFPEPREDIRGLLRGVARSIQDFPEALFIPSLVCVGDAVQLGEEVLTHDLYEDIGTFKDLKDHVLHASPAPRNVRGRRVTHKEAASIFLSRLTERLREDVGESLNVVLLFPSAGGEGFREWLRSVDLWAARSVTLLDEDTAVALGYGVNLFVDATLMVFDFGFSSLRARVVHFHWLGREAYTPPTVKASASLPVGTADLKQKILRELHSDAPEGPMPSFLWKRFVLHAANEEGLSNERFHEFLERENLAATVQQAIDRALDEASLSGVRKADIRKVLLIGGGTRIPAVRRTLEENFGERVLGEQPEHVAGRGGVIFLSDRPVDDMIRQTYSMQVRDPITAEFHYPVVVERYTRYPTRAPTARYIVNTFYDGQYEVHLRVYRTSRSGESSESREILFGADGKLSFVGGKTNEIQEPATAEPLVIPVNPPGRVGERRLLLEFGVDNQKRLVVTVRDLREEKVLWQDKAIVDLQ